MTQWLLRVEALATATFGSVGRRGSFLLIGTSCCALGLLGLALAESALAASVCCVCIGFGLILYLSTGQSALQIAVPDDMRGRVMAWWAMTLSASAPLGHLAAGFAVEALNAPGPVLYAMCAGVTCAALGLAVILSQRALK